MPIFVLAPTVGALGEAERRVIAGLRRGATPTVGALSDAVRAKIGQQ